MATSTPFTAGTSGYHTYRIPALVVTPAGMVLALAEGRVSGAGDTGDIDVVLRRSDDGGRNWLPQQVVVAHGGDTAANPAVVVEPASGDVLLLSCRQPPNVTSQMIRTGEAPPRRIYVQRSSNDGQTWSEPADISAQVRPGWMRGYGTGPGHGVALAGGRVVVPCWHTRTPAGTDTGAETKYYGAHGIYSDNGQTWTVGYTSSEPNGSMNENETACAVLPDGRLYVNSRCLPDGIVGYRGDAYSTDRGESLVRDIRPQATLPGPDCQGSLLTLPDNRLLYSGPSHPSERAALALWISDDDGATWRLTRHLTGLPSAYSDLALLPDGQTIGVLYETGDWSPYRRIEFATVPLAAV